eukprot:TRINITY_DN74012_c0_g1_i1.p1 TRINITY_DN74012_c0_g1~~TRINITY_DN74012_c0_g1_i1.p1  ORF type:complete len:432 (+),score=22.29 TRINITY_DN74012_c0_g1_i1:45-1298(+)
MICAYVVLAYFSSSTCAHRLISEREASADAILEMGTFLAERHEVSFHLEKSLLDKLYTHYIETGSTRTAFVQKSHIQKKNRLLIVADASKDSEADVLTMLYPSWERLRQSSSASCFIDLVLFCDEQFCNTRNKLCSQSAPKGEPSCNCFLVPEPTKPLEYRFQRSLQFLGGNSFAALTASGNYDFVMRLDADSVIAPGILEWELSSLQGAIGNGWMGTSYTHKRLELVSEDLGLRTRGVHGQQTTVMLPVSVALQAFQQMLNLTDIIYRTQFTQEKCSQAYEAALFARSPQLKVAAQKDIHDGRKNICAWPWWHRGVSSMYAQDIALNAVLPNLQRSMIIDTLDALATNEDEKRPSNHVMTIHMMRLKHEMKLISAPCQVRSTSGFDPLKNGDYARMVVIDALRIACATHVTMQQSQ